MNNTIKTLFALAAMSAGILTASCSKDNVAVKEFTATMEECTEQNSKTSLHNGFLYWQQGDQIKVYGNGGNYGIYTGNNAGGVTTFSLTSGDPGNGGYTAIYPASAANDDGTIELPAVQVTSDGSLTGFPMYATSSTTDLEFMHLCGVLRLRLQKSGVSVSAIEITSDVELTGRHSITVSGGEPSLTYVSYGAGNPHKSVMLVCNTAQNIGSPKDFYIYLPEHNYTSLRIRIYSNDGKVCTKTLNSGASVGISRGRITTITMSSSLSFTPNAGRLNGLFSVSDSKQVYFSQGNLQYTTLGIHNTATGTMPGIWRFAPNQYDVVGEANSNISNTYAGWIDLFGWGTSGWNSGAEAYMPYSTSYDWEDYTPDNYTSDNNEYGNLTNEYAYADWGIFNSVSNGENRAGQWRTLTYDEWAYLIHSRITVSGIRYVKATVNNIEGIILLPDNWNTSYYPLNSPNLGDVAFMSNSINATIWSNSFEPNGAVFLPAAGFRWDDGTGNSVFTYFSYTACGGEYWSSTGLYNGAKSLAMNNSLVEVPELSGRLRSIGISVRLVQDNN